MRSGRQWLLRIIGVLVVLVIGDVGAEMLRVSYWSPLDTNQVLRIFTYLHDMPRADILFLGTSRARAAVIPAEFEDLLSSGLGRQINAYCLAQNGGNAYTSWLLLNDAVAVHGPPEAVILELSPASRNSNPTNVARDLEHYSSISEIVSAARWIDTSDRLTGAAAGYFRGISSMTLYGLRFVYSDSVEGNLASYRRLKGAALPRQLMAEYRPPPEPNAVRRHAQLDTAVRLTRRLYMRDYEVGGAPEAGFAAMVEFASEHDIPLILVDPPVTPDYGKAIFAPTEFAEYRDAVDRALEDPRSTLVEADLSRLEITEEDFQDLTHLNPVGARKFSRHLAESVLLPLMSEQEELNSEF